MLVRIVIIAAALAPVAAGCGGAETRVSHPASLSAADLRALVRVAPDATGWGFSVSPRTRTMSAPIRLDPTKPSHAIEARLTDAYEKAGFSAGATSDWYDPVGKASSFANLMTDPDAARSALAAERVFQRAWYADFESVAVDEDDLNGLGTEAWSMRGVTGSGRFAQVSWAEGPLTLSVYVSCNPCRHDVLDAARSWAAAIDAEARARS